MPACFCTGFGCFPLCLGKNRAFFQYDIFQLITAENQQHHIIQSAHEEHFIRGRPMDYIYVTYSCLLHAAFYDHAW